MNQRHTKASLIAAAAILALAVGAQGQNYRKALGIARDTINKANSGGKTEKPKRRPRKTAPSDPKKLTAGEIIDKANFVSYYQGDDSRANVTMEIVDAAGVKTSREMTILRLDGADSTGEVTAGQKYYVYISRPAELAGTALLVLKHADKPVERKLYSPSVGKIEIIPPEKARTSFAGSSFFYEDLTGRDSGADVHELLADQTDETYFVIKSTPKDPKSVEFTSYKTRIDRKTFVAVWRTYFGKAGKAIRTCEVNQHKKIKGVTAITRSRMTDLQTKAYTDLKFDKVQYDTGLSERIFTERSLAKPPLQQIQGK